VPAEITAFSTVTDTANAPATPTATTAAAAVGSNYVREREMGKEKAREGNIKSGDLELTRSQVGKQYELSGAIGSETKSNDDKALRSCEKE
jgi:hypothetical protein